MGVFKDGQAPLQIALNEQLVQAETIRNSVGATQPAQPRTAPPVELSPDQKKLVNQVFNLDQHAQDLILKHLKPLKDEDKKEKTMELLKQLYELIRIGGDLHIGYEYSPTSDPKSPSEVLKKLRGNCEELSILFVAAAKYLNADMSVIGLLDMPVTIQNIFPQLAHQRHTVALKTDAEKYVVDFTFEEIGISKVSSFDQSDLFNLYKNKGHRGITGTVLAVGEDIRIAESDAAMAAVHFKQCAASHDTHKPELAIQDLETALILTPDDSKLKADIVQRCLHIAETAYPINKSPESQKIAHPDWAKAKEYANKAISADENDAIAHRDLGSLYLAKEMFSSAVVEFKATLKSDSSDTVAQYNLAFSLFNLRRFKEADSAFTAMAPEFDEKDYRQLGFDIYTGSENYAQLVAFSDSVLVRDPHDGLAYRKEFSALVVLSQTQSDKAGQYLEKAKTIAEDARNNLPSSSEDYIQIKNRLEQLPPSK